MACMPASFMTRTPHHLIPWIHPEKYWINLRTAPGGGAPSASVTAWEAKRVDSRRMGQAYGEMVASRSDNY